MNNGYDYPSKLKWEELPEDAEYCCVTVPSNFFEPSACNLSQMKVGTYVERKYAELLLFLINCFNDASVGSKTGGSSDMYFTFDEYSSQKGILMDGERSSSTLPKYKIYVEFLARDVGSLVMYDHENIEGLSKIFSEDNFCGIRFWFIFFDPEYNIHSAIKKGIYKNQESAIVKSLRKQKWSKAGISKFLKLRREKDNEGMFLADMAKNLEPEDQGQSKPRKATYNGNMDVDWRAICEQVNIKSKDMANYHRGINSYKRFGTLVDIVKGTFECSKLDKLDDKFYNIEDNNSSSNPLHVYHWGSFGCGKQFIRRKINQPSNNENESEEYYEYFISREQGTMGNYFVEKQETDGFSFQFPFPNLTWSLRPEFCSLKQMLKRDFPWRNISRFDALYQEIITNHEKQLETMKLKMNQEKLEKMKNDNKGVELTENGQTEDQERTMLKLNKMKEIFYSESMKNEENFELEDDLVDYISKTNYILDENEIRNKKSLESSNTQIMKDNGTTIFEELGRRNRDKHKKLIYGREICPERYPELMKLYLEETLADFVKIFKPETEGMQDSVKHILFWFENETKIIRSNPDNKAKYKSLALEYNTMDLSIGRNNYSFAADHLYLDALVPVANIHRNLFAALKSAYYVYIMPSKAKEDIGTSIKPAIFQLGAPGTSKSFLLELLKLVSIDGTIVSLDGFTDKALQTGDTKLTDIIAIIDEMGSTFTQDPQKMQGDQLERYRNMKTYMTAGKHQRVVCRYEDNNRETETIRTNISMSVIGCANSLHTGSDASLYDRGTIVISNPMKRVDKDTISLMCTTYSDTTRQNREVLFILKNRVIQYLFCEIGKMLGSLTMPIKVNIEIGKILKSNTVRLLSQIFVGLDKKIRSSQKLLVNMVSQAIMDAIDVCYFSEASPFMIRKTNGKIKYVEFSHKQVQSIMPALCLSEDSAIREIISWLQNELYNDFAYKSLVYTAQKFCGFKFYKPKQSEDLHNFTQAYIKDNDYPSNKETYMKIKSIISKSMFIPDSEKEDYKEYSNSRTDTVESIMKSKYYLRMRRQKIGVKERETFYYDTNYVEIFCNSEKTFKKKWYDSLPKEMNVTQDVIDVAYKAASEMVIRAKPRRVYKQTVDGTKTPILDEEDEDSEEDTYCHGFYKPDKYYSFKALKYQINPNNPSKSKMLISVEFLYAYSFNNILHLALQSMSHKHTRERNIVIPRLVDGTPHLFQIYRLVPNDNIKLIIENPNHMNEHMSKVVFSQTDVYSKRNMCKTRKQEFTEYDCDLEEKIFVEHAIDCGMDPETDAHKIKYFVPSNINKTILAYHNSDINLRFLDKIEYPLTFVANINKKRNTLERRIMKQYENTGLLQFGDVCVAQNVDITGEQLESEDSDDVDFEDFDDLNKPDKNDKMFLEKITPIKGTGKRKQRPKSTTKGGRSDVIDLKKPKRKKRRNNRYSEIIMSSFD